MRFALAALIVGLSSPALAACPAGTSAANVGGVLVCNVVGNAVLDATAGSGGKERLSLLDHDFIVQVFDRGAGTCVETNPATGTCACSGESVRDASQWTMNQREHKITLCTAGQPFDRILKLCYVRCAK